MHVNAFALATMASFPLRPPEKAKGRTEEERREDEYEARQEEQMEEQGRDEKYESGEP
jgi:hypothetical protein